MGIDSRRFIAVDPDLLCGICHDVLENPAQVCILTIHVLAMKCFVFVLCIFVAFIISIKWCLVVWLENWWQSSAWCGRYLYVARCTGWSCFARHVAEIRG